VETGKGKVAPRRRGKLVYVNPLGQLKNSLLWKVSISTVRTKRKFPRKNERKTEPEERTGRIEANQAGSGWLTTGRIAALARTTRPSFKRNTGGSTTGVCAFRSARSSDRLREKKHNRWATERLGEE